MSLRSTNIQRRAFLAGTAAALTLPSAVPSQQPPALDEQVVQHVKQLTSGHTAGLKMLIPQGSRANVAIVASEFTARTSVAVQLIEVAVDEINTRLTLDFLAGNAPYDLALPATFGIPDLAISGTIRSLSDYVRRYEPPRFRDDALYTTGDTFDDEVYGFQTDGDTYLMFYQSDWLSDAENQARYADTFGAELRVPETWKELDQQLAFFHQPKKGLYGGALFRTPSYLAWEWWVRFHAKGFWPLSPDLKPQIASDAGIEALEDMIAATQYLHPQTQSAGLFENWKLYAEGKTYCNIGWGGSQKYFNSEQSAIRGRLQFGPTPGGLVNGKLLRTPYFNWGWTYVVTTSSTQSELAYLFALFACTARLSTLSVREQNGYFDPFRAEHYLDPKIRDAYSPDFLEVHEASLRSSIPDLYLENQTAYLGALGDGLYKAITGVDKPKQALQRVANQWVLINRRSDRTAQMQRWKRLRSKYPPQIRRVLRDLQKLR